MDSNCWPYDHVASFARLDGILAQSQSSYEEVDALPDPDRRDDDHSCHTPVALRSGRAGGAR
jgi:hypothetical protein